MSSMPRKALKTRASKPGLIVVVKLEAQGCGPGDHLLGVGNLGRGDLVHHFGGRVARRALGADIEYLNDALGVGGDAREVGAVENRPLQGPRFRQSLFRLPTLRLRDQPIVVRPIGHFSSLLRGYSLGSNRSCSTRENQATGARDPGLSSQTISLENQHLSGNSSFYHNLLMFFLTRTCFVRLPAGAFSRSAAPPFCPSRGAT